MSIFKSILSLLSFIPALKSYTNVNVFHIKHVVFKMFRSQDFPVSQMRVAPVTCDPEYPNVYVTYLVSNCFGNPRYYISWKFINPSHGPGNYQVKEWVKT